MAIRFFVLALILAMNAFFAAAEVCLVSVRQSRLRELAAEGQAGAQSALNLLANPSRLLSVTQVGVTLASLGLGWAGEDTVYALLRRALEPFSVPVSPVFLHAICFAAAFLLISYAHVVIGEVVPKNIGLAKADRLALVVAPALLVFYRIVQPFIVVIERSAALLLKALGLGRSRVHGGHTPEELKYIIESSRLEGHLQSFEQHAIERVIEVSNYSVREIMTPRNDIVSLPVDASLDRVLSVMAAHKFSRLPIYEDRPEQIIGILHYKDLMRFCTERQIAGPRRLPAFRLRRLLYKPLVVPETKPVSQLIDTFRAGHTPLALVVDEFGIVAGLVTLSDVLEQIFGETGDEHDTVRPAPSYEEKVLQLQGSTSIRDLETRYRLILPGEAGFETLAGFLLLQFGYIPKVKDSIEYAGRRFTVTEMERNRIATVLIEKIESNREPDPLNEG